MTPATRSARRTATLLAALLLAGCCCAPARRCCDPCGATGEGGAPAAARRGVLAVSTEPAGEVWIDGAPAGFAPVESEVAGGSHTVVVRLGGFEEFSRTVNVDGARASVAGRLVARDVEDRQVLQMLAPKQMWVRAYDAPETLRGGEAAAGTVAVYPRGEVRAADLLQARIDFGEKAGAGEVRFQREDTVLAREVADETTVGAWIRPVPTAVQEGLQPGDKVTWGWYPAKGDAVEASFEVVERDVETKIKAIDDSMVGQPKTAATYLHITVYEDAGLAYAAHQEALRAIREGRGTLRAWAAVLSTLRKMAVPEAALAWREARSRIASFARSEQDEVFAGGEYGTAKAVAHLRAGRAGRALQSLDTERMSALSQTGREARRVVSAASASAGRLVERSPGAARRLAGALVTMAKSARDQAPKDPDAAAAYATAMVGQARTQSALGEAPKADAWRDAAKSVTAGYDEGLSDDGRAYLQAVGWLREAAGSHPADRAALIASAQEYAAKAKAAFPDSGAAAAAEATVLLARAEQEAAKDAKARLQEGLAVLKPHLGQDPLDPDAATAHTDLVSLDRRRDFGLGTAYLQQSRVGAQDLVKYAFPAGSRWKASEDLPAGHVVYLEQSDWEGELLRTIAVRAIQWTADYTFTSGAESGGENTSLLASHDLDEMRRSFAKLKEPGRVSKKPFSKKFPRADAYEVSGTDHEGGFRRTRGWVFKSEKQKVTFMVNVDEFPRARADDPEWEVFKDGFADVGAKR